MTAPPVVDEQAVRRALREVKDPELDMNIIDLGLVYDVEVDGGEVRVKMTLTSPGCPAGPMITNDAYRVIRGLAGVQDVDIEIVWEPYWTPDRMDPKVRALEGVQDVDVEIVWEPYWTPDRIDPKVRALMGL